MPLVVAKCTQCGADLKVDSDAKRGICQYCHTEYITEDVINNFNNFYNYNYNYNIKNATLEIKDEKSVSNQLENAEIYLSHFKNYTKAKKIFKNVTEIAPGNYRGWWGLIRCQTLDFTKSDLGQATMQTLNEYFRHASTFADPDERNEIQNKWEAFIKSQKNWESTQNDKINDCYSNITEINSQIYKIQCEQNDLQNTISLYNDKSKKYRDGYCSLIAIIMILLGAGFSIFSMLLINLNLHLFILFLLISLTVFVLGLFIKVSINSAYKKCLQSINDAKFKLDNKNEEIKRLNIQINDETKKIDELNNILK